jgi:hypothetical protein
MSEFKIGDRVRRKKCPDYQCNKGTIESINEYGRCYIIWDEKSDNGQQHSTLQQKFLDPLGE